MAQFLRISRDQNFKEVPLTQGILFNFIRFLATSNEVMTGTLGTAYKS